jgi:hypothetical protein
MQDEWGMAINFLNIFRTFESCACSFFKKQKKEFCGKNKLVMSPLVWGSNTTPPAKTRKENTTNKNHLFYMTGENQI